MEDAIIDTNSLNFDAFHQILSDKVYDEGIDSDLLWSIIIGRLFRYRDDDNPKRALTNEEKDDFVDRADKFLSGVPFDYDFYFRLPEKYPLDAKKISKNITIIKADQEFVDKQEKINPPDSFDSILRRGAQQHNHRLLNVGRFYLKIEDKGLVITGRKAFLESTYSPDRIFGIYLALHLLTENLSADKLARDNPTSHVYDKSGKYRANFVSPVRSSRAEHLEFLDKKDTTEMANKVFLKLISKQSEKNLESARIQICNSLYWYIEFLNSEETSLQLVFLVSAFDSLFPPRHHSVFKNKQITPTVLEKAPLIAEVTSSTQDEYQRFLVTMENLFDARNNVIHGKIEIHGYQRGSKLQNKKTVELVEESTKIFETYIKRRMAKFIS